LWKWYRDILRGAIKRKNITITVVSMDGSGTLQWSFHDACPVKWVGPELHSLSSTVAFESIELVHRGLLLEEQHG
jgi:phage tail-like protein